MLVPSRTSDLWGLYSGVVVGNQVGCQGSLAALGAFDRHTDPADEKTMASTVTSADDNIAFRQTSIEIDRPEIGRARQRIWPPITPLRKCGGIFGRHSRLCELPVQPSRRLPSSQLATRGGRS